MKIKSDKVYLTKVHRLSDLKSQSNQIRYIYSQTIEVIRHKIIR